MKLLLKVKVILELKGNGLDKMVITIIFELKPPDTGRSNKKSHPATLLLIKLKRPRIIR